MKTNSSHRDPSPSRINDRARIQARPAHSTSAGFRPTAIHKFMLGALLVSGLALAGSLQDARALHARGDWANAIQMAVSLRTADGYALAAHSNSVAAQLAPEAQQAALYDQSEDYANQAIKLDPKNAEGYFERGRALGRLGQLRGILNAFTQGYGTRIRESFEKALELNPRSASAITGLGIWHAEVSAQGVGWLYGADTTKIVPLFEQAIKLEPDVITHRTEYARALMLMDPARNKARATELLEKAASMKADDAEARIELERARRNLNDLKK